MAFSIKEISKSDFEKAEVPILFEDNRLADRVFAIISNGENTYKFGWQSTDIKPVVIWVNHTICSVGIDLTFILFDFVSGKTIKRISLDHFFYGTKILNGYLYVITELEIIKISTTDFTIDNRYDLSDFFESIEQKEGSILVKSIDGRTIDLNDSQ